MAAVGAPLHSARSGMAGSNGDRSRLSMMQVIYIFFFDKIHIYCYSIGGMKVDWYK